MLNPLQPIFRGYKPSDQTIVFFAAARRVGQDAEAQSRSPKRPCNNWLYKEGYFQKAGSSIPYPWLPTSGIHYRLWLYAKCWWSAALTSTMVMWLGATSKSSYRANDQAGTQCQRMWKALIKSGYPHLGWIFPKKQKWSIFYLPIFIQEADTDFHVFPISFEMLVAGVQEMHEGRETKLLPIQLGRRPSSSKPGAFKHLIPNSRKLQSLGAQLPPSVFQLSPTCFPVVSQMFPLVTHCLAFALQMWPCHCLVFANCPVMFPTCLPLVPHNAHLSLRCGSH